MSSSHQTGILHQATTVEGEGQKWPTLLSVGMATIVGSSDVGVSGIVTPALVDAFSSDISTIVWFSVIFMVAGTGLLLTMGWLGDALGRRRLFLSGFVVFTAGLALVSVAQNLAQLFAFRAIQGIGMALLMSNLLAFITAAFPAQERGKAMGLNAVFLGAGLTIGPLLGGLLLEHMDWRAAYWSRIPVGVLGFFVAARFIPEQRSVLPGPLRVDYRGIVLLYATVSVFLLSMNLAGRLGLDNPMVWCLAIAAGVLMPLLIFVEQKAARPVLDLSLLRNRVFAVSHVTLGLHFAALGALNFLAPFYLLKGLGVSHTVMGVLIGILAGARIIAGPLGGLLHDRIGSRIPTATGLGVMIIGLLLLWWFSGDAHLWVIVVLFGLIGTGSAMFDSANVSAITVAMGVAHRDRLGTASGLNVTILQTTMSAGMAMGGAIFATRELVNSQRLAMGGLDTSIVMSESARTSFSEAVLVMAVLVGLGVVVTWFRGKA